MLQDLRLEWILWNFLNNRHKIQNMEYKESLSQVHWKEKEEN
jgi:hypothetical protein